MSDEDLARVAYGSNKDKQYSAQDKQDAVRRLSAKGLSAKSFSSSGKKVSGGAGSKGTQVMGKKTQKEMEEDEEEALGLDPASPVQSKDKGLSSSSSKSQSNGGVSASGNPSGRSTKSLLQLRREKEDQKKADYDAKKKEKVIQMRALGSQPSPALVTKEALDKKKEEGDSYTTI
jgi:hypothetical protein